MRREGYEFQVSRPRVITHRGPDGERLEPYEELAIDVPEEFMGVVMEELGPRKAQMIEMKNPGQGLIRLLYKIPARGLFGYRSEFMTDTRGTGIIHHRFLEYGAWAGSLEGRGRGVLVSMESGTIVAFALANLQDRSTLFVAPGADVYEGMIVGENSRPGDMDVESTREKKLSNMRSKSADDAISLEPPRELTLEVALEYIEDDELIEVTPKSIRLRKRKLAVKRPEEDLPRGQKGTLGGLCGPMPIEGGILSAGLQRWKPPLSTKQDACVRRRPRRRAAISPDPRAAQVPLTEKREYGSPRSYITSGRRVAVTIDLGGARDIWSTTIPAHTFLTAHRLKASMCRNGRARGLSARLAPTFRP